MQKKSVSKRRTSTSNSLLPDGVKTSARIIEDARNSVKLVPTSRPYTPIGDRNLFGAGQRTVSSGRPPSNISLGPPAYIDEPFAQVRPRTLDPISTPTPASFVPPTPVQSLVNVEQITPTITTSLQNNHTSSPTPPGQLPELKMSKSSPVTSRRVKSSERAKRSSIVTVGSVKNALPITSQPSTIGSKTDDTKHTSSDDRRVLSGTKREAIEEWERTISPLLKILQQSNESVAATRNELMKDACDELWKALQDGEFFGRMAGQAGKKRRSDLLRCLYQLLGCNDPAILLKLLKIILSMKVVGGNLLKVCQHVFMLSKEESNDQFFINENMAGPLVDVLMSIDPMANADTTIYGLGTVKLMSCNQTLRVSLRDVGVTKMLASFLEKSCQKNVSFPSSIIIQVVATLRNLSDNGEIYEEFISQGILSLLSQVLSDHKDNPEIVFYGSRFLSKLTLHTNCSECLSHCGVFLSIAPQLITIHNYHQDIVVRLCFILGNLTSMNTSLAHELYHTHKLHPAIDKTLEYYYELLLKPETTPNGCNETTVKNVIDVLIKMIRLIANLCVHCSVGTHFANETQTLEKLLAIVEKSSSSTIVSEELVINTLVVFNNLSYHADIESDDVSLCKVHEDLAKVIVNLLLIDNDEVLLECVRVLGNISKQQKVRNIMTTHRVDELLVTLLDSSRLELVFSTCGVLINLMADPQHRGTFKNNQGIKKLVDVLSHYGRQDWQLSSLVCKIIWNYSDGEALDRDEKSNVYHLLEEFLDPVTAFTAYMIEEDEEELHSSRSTEPADDSLSSQTHTLWEKEFSPVAQMLLHKLQS